MKHFLSVIFALCFLSMLHAQNNMVSIGQKTDGSDLKAEYYPLGEDVQTFSMEPKCNYLCLNFRNLSKNGKYWKNKGNIGLFSMKDRKLMWKSPINYQMQIPMCTSAGILVTTSYDGAMLDTRTGKEVWKTDIYPVSIDDSLGVIVGYSSPSSTKLRAITLDKGLPMWNTKLTHNYGWNNIYALPGNKRLIVADELHRINLLTGENLTYDIKPGVSDTKGMLLQGLAMMAGAVAGSFASGGAYTYMPVMVGGNVITGMVSNIVQKDSLFYLADHESIQCVDSLLQPVWKHEIADKMASHSQLILKGDSIYMLNFGYGRRNGNIKTKKGRPFIAAYNCKTGDEIFLNQLSLKKDMIEDVILTGNSFYMLFDNRITYQNLNDSTISTRQWDENKYGQLSQLLPDTLYVFDPEKKDFSPICFDGIRCPVYSGEREQVYVIDKDININATYPLSLIYLPILRLKDYYCIAKDNDYWFVHKLGMPVAHFQMDLRKKIAFDNKLIMLNTKNELFYLDLDEAIR